MRKRDIKLGMEVQHALSGKPLGRVVAIGDAVIRLDGECPIATPAEIAPVRPPVAVDTELLYSTTDAMVWAVEFQKVVDSGVKIDEGLMVGWFANAIETAKSMTQVTS